MTVHEAAGSSVRVRADGDVGEKDLAHVRAKVEAALARPGLGEVSGEVRVARAAAHHAGQPWSAGAEIRVGKHAVLVRAEEATAHELADRLADRLRVQAERVAHRAGTARRSAGPPPWRGGEADARAAEKVPPREV
ncbi:hypothetical protein [Streptomyces brasiliensis]|uniref:Uncharacterized protein n=1 Tax=Streptomyces brasiliensis TaxID=1954 RepID=A0A917NK30_9ACTN|nr:hypothetical protein [Streptomyces brasiliensis]GGJ06579.1 hypothetical protein GCM10010121_016340 [Streptomyces brasiliensis]